MKRLLTFFAVICFTLISQLNAQQGSQNNPFTALEGINTSYFNGTYYLYYVIKMPCDGTIEFTSQTEQYFEITAINETQYNYEYLEFSGYDTNTFSAHKNDSIRLVVYSSNNNLIPWTLSISSGLIPGSFCENPIQAHLGDNITGNSKEDQWFAYTPDIDGLLEVSSCGLTTENTYLQIYSSCDNLIGENNDFCNNQSSYSAKVLAGETYYIKWLNYYTNKSFHWNLSMGDLNTETDITYFNLYSNDSGDYILTREPVINPVNHTVTAYVSRDFDLSNYVYPILGTSPGAAISINGNNLWQGWTINQTNYFYGYDTFDDSPSTCLVTSQDGANTQEWELSILNESELFSGNSFLSYVVQNDSGTIDESNHIIHVNFYGSNPSSLSTKFISSPLSKVYLNGTLYSNQDNHYFNYTDTLIFSVVSESGLSQDWKVIADTGLGQDCIHATEVFTGVTYGNGYYHQYFYYTADQTGVAIVDALANDVYFYIYSGTCGSLSYEAYGYGAVFSAVEGQTYIIESYYLYQDGLTISYNNSIPKEISYFYSYDPYYGYEYADIDTVNNTINLSVGARVDLTNMYYELAPLFSNYITVSIEGSDINNWGYRDFSSPLVLTLTDDFSTTAEFTVSVTKRPLNYGNEILAYALQNQIGEAVIDPYSHSIKIGIDTTGVGITALRPVFVISEQAYATDEDSVIQQSFNTYRDFSDTVKYDVYSEDNSVVRWNVFPVIGQPALNNKAELFSYKYYIEGEQITIDNSAKTIDIRVPLGTDLSALSGWFTLSKGATASVNGDLQLSGSSTLNFSNPVIYSITSQDGSVSNYWTVKVELFNTETRVISFRLPGQKKSTINIASHIITVYMPVGTDVTNLIATFSLSEQAISRIEGLEQVSGVTANNFSSPLHYVVTAGDGVTAGEWIVYISNASGIEDHIQNISMVAYPNPTDGSFILKLKGEQAGEATIEIISVDGRCVYSKQLNITGETSENINLQIDAGSYILRVKVGNAISQQILQIVR